mmetsp:Transcript_25842/g.66608  ORF Transcript_25842/g.66608 Transcript_25842/m.66608 type:complete len:221 (+) Transcript_25842:289-951(+)
MHPLLQPHSSSRLSWDAFRGCNPGAGFPCWLLCADGWPAAPNKPMLPQPPSLSPPPSGATVGDHTLLPEKILKPASAADAGSGTDTAAAADACASGLAWGAAPAVPAAAAPTEVPPADVLSAKAAAGGGEKGDGCDPVKLRADGLGAGASMVRAVRLREARPQPRGAPGAASQPLKPLPSACKGGGCVCSSSGTAPPWEPCCCCCCCCCCTCTCTAIWCW